MMRHRKNKKRYKTGLKLLALMGLGLAIIPFQKSFSILVNSGDDYRVESQTLDLLDQVLEKSGETKLYQIRK